MRVVGGMGRVPGQGGGRREEERSSGNESQQERGVVGLKSNRLSIKLVLQLE